MPIYRTLTDPDEIRLYVGTGLLYYGNDGKWTPDEAIWWPTTKQSSDIYIRDLQACGIRFAVLVEHDHNEEEEDDSPTNQCGSTTMKGSTCDEI